MRNFIYVIISIVALALAVLFCFHAWMEKELLVHQICFHRYNGAAVLANKMYYADKDDFACWWKPTDRPKVDERWGTCHDFNVGDTNYNYPEASYTCD